MWRFGRLRCTTINDMIPVFLCLCEFFLVTFHFSFFIFHFHYLLCSLSGAESSIIGGCIRYYRIEQRVL